MEYFYDTHVHTAQGSACASATGAEHARGYKALGYTGIIITDHFFNGNTAVDRGLPWTQWVDAFCLGYEQARTEGEKIGLDVFFGWEAGYQGTEFLIFGLDNAWLKRHPDIPNWTVEEQYRQVHAAGGVVIQAHPFREAFYIPQIRVYPGFIDGVEAVNTANYEKSPGANEKAKAYARERKLCMTGGSDTHHQPSLRGGMVFDHQLSDIRDFIDTVESRKGYRLLEKEDGR